MSTRQYDKFLGIILLIVGILGYIPGIAPHGMLMGIFMVGPIHNIIHILSGIILAAVGFGNNETTARNVTLAFAAIYGIVTIVGFATGNVFGLFPVNMSDNILHLIITASALLVAIPRRYHRPV
jgi:hypothetical protein